MRTLTAYERQTVAWPRRGTYRKIEVQNADGTWIDYSSYLISGSLGEDIDQPVGSASFQLRRKNGAGVSLAPLVTTSTLNVNGVGAYAPALDVGRLIRYSTATTRFALQPGTNSILQSATLAVAPWGSTATASQTATGLDGIANSGTTITDSSAINFQDRNQTITIPNNSATHSVRIWIKKDATTTRAPQPRLSLTGGRTVTRSLSLNTSSGLWIAANAVGTGTQNSFDGALIGDPGFWVVDLSCTNNSTGNTAATVTLYPAARATYNGTDDPTVTGSIDVGGVVLQLNSNTVGGFIKTTTVAVSDYHEVFTGRVNAVAWEQDPIELDCSSPDAWLQDTQIEILDKEYGTTPVGTALETVMQNILNDSPSGVGAVPILFKQSASIHAVTAWRQGRVKVLEGIRNINQQAVGEDVRFRYDSAGVSRLTWFNPDRTRVTIDATIGPTEYRDVRRLSMAIPDIRNAGLVPYTDASGVAQTYTASDPLSIAKYGRRYFELPSNTAIDTVGEATTLLTAVLNDISGAPAEQEIILNYAWFVQLYDRYTYTQNGDHYDADQTLAVVGYRHEFTAEPNGDETTTIRAVGRVVGAYADWQRGIITRPTLVPQLIDIRQDDTDTTSTFSWTRSAGVSEVWTAALIVATPEAESDWATVAALSTPLPAGVDTLTVTRPRDGEVALIQLEPRTADYAAGVVRRLKITAAPQPPLGVPDDLELATTATQRIDFTTRGINITTVEARVQVGSSPISAWVTPSRGPGGVSSVQGGTLPALAYEHDLPRDANRSSYVEFRATLENGQESFFGPYQFDRDKNPNLGALIINGTLITVPGDIDTKSVKLASTTRAWTMSADGAFATFDIAVADVSANAGLGAGASDTFTATAYSDPIAEIGGSTLSDSRPQVLGNGAAAPAAVWLQCQAIAPAVGDDEMTIKLQASAAPAGPWSVKVFIAEPSTGTYVDRTALLTPVPTVPPTALTTYAYTTIYTRTNPGTHTELRTVGVRAELRDSGGVIKDSKTFSVSWYVASIL